MPAANIIISNDELGDEDILQLNSANFSLRMALIFLIVTVIIFALTQLIKLICQIWTISSKVAEPQNEIQNTAEISAVPHGEIQKSSDLQNLSPAMTISTGEKPILPKIKAQDSLMVINNQTSKLQPVDNIEQRNPAAQIKEQEPTLLAAKLQDSLMVVNSHTPLQPARNVEGSNLEMATKQEK